MFRITLVFVCLLPLLIKGQDSLLTAYFDQGARPLVCQDGVLSGPGADFLDEVGEVAHFMLIGEAHGLAELPRFTSALFQAFRKRGYRYFATETGPYAAAFLESTFRSGAGREEWRQFYRELPWSIPFYGWEEEVDILETVIEGTASAPPVLWGIDQEFAASFRMFFRQLVSDATADQARETAKAFFDRAQDGMRQATETGNPTAAFMFSAKEEDFARLRHVFAGQAEQLQLIDELEESIAIYQLWSRGQGFASNVRRSKLMKRYFREYYQAAQGRGEHPKVMFKLGANHVYRGANGLNVFDIGNYVSELADHERKQSFHLYVAGLEGTQNAYTPFSTDEGDNHKPFRASDYLDHIDFSSLMAARDGKEWWLIDLRPLRSRIFNREIQVEDSGLHKLIHGYDALLVIPEVSASTRIE